MILATRHTGLVVHDLEKSLAFYIDVLGLKLWKRAFEKGDYIENVVGIKQVLLEWAKLQCPDGSLLELLQYHSHPINQLISYAPANQLGCSHVAFTVANIDEAYQILCQQGFYCKATPQLSPDGKAKVMYCHDPDGIILELVEEIKS